MADAINATEQACYDALSTPAAVSAPIYQHVPKDAEGPLVILGDFENVRRIGNAGDPDREGNLTILTLTEGEQRIPCLTIMAQINAALDGQTFATDGFNVTMIFETSSSYFDETGMYVGETNFSFVALKQ